MAAIASVAAGCPGATIPFAPLAPGNPRFGAPNVPLINDVRCANDFPGARAFRQRRHRAGAEQVRSMGRGAAPPTSG